MDERVKKRQKRLQDGGTERKRGSGGQRLREAGPVPLIPGFRRESRSRQKSHCDPCEEGGLVLRSLCRQDAFRVQALLLNSAGVSAGKNIYGCAYKCAGVGCTHVHISVQGLDVPRVHICVQGLDVHVCIYVCRGWTCMCVYMSVGGRRARVYICVQVLDVHVCIYVCRGWTCTWVYMCVGDGRARVYICVQG